MLEEDEDDLFLFFETQCFYRATSAALSVSGADGARPLWGFLSLCAILFTEFRSDERRYCEMDRMG